LFFAPFLFHPKREKDWYSICYHRKVQLTGSILKVFYHKEHREKQRSQSNILTNNTPCSPLNNQITIELRPEHSEGPITIELRPEHSEGPITIEFLMY